MVAPLVGAWIEITKKVRKRNEWKVAPLVGAWIEICIFWVSCKPYQSLLSWERGLKSHKRNGTKRRSCRSSRGSVDWNSLILEPLFNFTLSLLSWERGLKYDNTKFTVSKNGRSSRGSVDWNLIKDKDYNAYDTVAPLVGAWIEM